MHGILHIPMLVLMTLTLMHDHCGSAGQKQKISVELSPTATKPAINYLNLLHVTVGLIFT